MEEILSCPQCRCEYAYRVYIIPETAMISKLICNNCDVELRPDFDSLKFRMSNTSEGW